MKQKQENNNITFIFDSHDQAIQSFNIIKSAALNNDCESIAIWYPDYEECDKTTVDSYKDIHCIITNRCISNKGLGILYYPKELSEILQEIIMK